MLARPRVIRYPLILLVTFLSFFALLAHYDLSLGSVFFSFIWPTGTSSASKGANATLGFGGIYVVSALSSTRRDHLEQAAAVTELDLTIPTQKQWTQDDILAFRFSNRSKSHAGEGSIRAWLSHHLVLRDFLDNSDLETVLVIEDDVDWDIRLRIQQVPLAQKAAQSLVQPRFQDPVRYPWGRTTSWDLLYMGHCGDYWNPADQGIGVGHHHPQDLNRLRHTIWPDDSVSYFTDLHPYTASLLSAFRIPEKHRVLHRSVFPLCSFGYAVTRAGAQKILTEVAPPNEDLLGEPAYAYDVSLLNGCARDAKIKCYSLQPEFFHHMHGDSLVGIVEGNHWMSPIDVKGSEQVAWRGETSNIDCGFWSGEFYYDGDLDKLEALRREVGRKGRCLKPNRDRE